VGSWGAIGLTQGKQRRKFREERLASRKIGGWGHRDKRPRKTLGGNESKLQKWRGGSDPGKREKNELIPGVFYEAPTEKRGDLR